MRPNLAGARPRTAQRRSPPQHAASVAPPTTKHLQDGAREAWHYFNSTGRFFEASYLCTRRYSVLGVVDLGSPPRAAGSITPQGRCCCCCCCLQHQMLPSLTFHIIFKHRIQ